MTKDLLKTNISNTISPPKRWELPNLKELWEYRELIFQLARRNLRVTYAQTIIGMGWALVPPIANMLIYSFLFGYLGNFPSEGVPYIVLVFSGLVPWGLFVGCLEGVRSSFVSEAGIAKKVYFPRLSVALASIISYFPL
ncbi:MAG: ABC transporter permease [Bacteroidales bacterium]|nr:ABC transporter permease [Bacteroidales bacterium]